MQKNIYQFDYKFPGQSHAGSKAPKDVTDILKKRGVITLSIPLLQFRKLSFLQKIFYKIYLYFKYTFTFNKIKKDTVLFLQYPLVSGNFFFTKILTEKKKKDLKIITLVHDLEELRFKRSDQIELYREKFKKVEIISDILIVHNNMMIEYLLKTGVNESKLVDLKIFDYLLDSLRLEDIQYAKVLNIAGNLDLSKASYLGQLKNLSNININLYGPNFDSETLKCNTLHYQGCFPPEEIPSKFIKGFGLIWDGTSLDCCDGDFGEYLKYNNPHKLSLYLVSGMPVVIWQEAAESVFVKENQCGIIVKSLYEADKKISSLSESEYATMIQGAKKVSEKLRNGYYLNRAFDESLNRIFPMEEKVN